MSDAQLQDDFGGLIDRQRLDAWLAVRPEIPGHGPLTATRRLTGGLQNAVFMLQRGDASFVLRRPSKHLREGSNETMLREARILGALAGTVVPHPALIAVCDDPGVIGCCFYLMRAAEGFAQSGTLPGRYTSEPSWRREMGLALVRAAVALGSIEPAAIGLADLGRAESWHERQVARWRRQLDGYRATPGYDTDALPHVDAVGRWLGDNLPRDRRIGLVHGDLQFPNVMFSLEAPRVSAILDWELASLGDPLLDLGWILSSWHEDGDPPGRKPMVQPWDGFATRAELVRLYGERSGRDMREMPWFFALACYKLACLLEGTYARSLAGQVPASVGASVHAYAVWLMHKAAQITAG